MTINIDRQKRRGRNPLDDPRTHCVSVRLNDVELALLDSKVGGMARGEWMRCAALDKLPKVIPIINHKQWVELAKLAGNLNQIARAFNSHGIKDDAQVAEARAALAELRKQLVGHAD